MEPSVAAPEAMLAAHWTFAVTAQGWLRLVVVTEARAAISTPHVVIWILSCCGGLGGLSAERPFGSDQSPPLFTGCLVCFFEA